MTGRPTLETLDRLSLRLREVLNYLDHSPRALLTTDDASRLSGRARALADEIKAADDRICIGLVGGTGVGKSTLINALAGSEISASSDLRPTTDRLVLYRHRDNSFSLADDERVHVHDAPALKRVSLADFPDFDSLEQRHRATLARLFPKLDLLLWVVDPAKYADQALFDWLDLAPQARESYLFVFNKTDEFDRRYPTRAESIREDVLADFRAKLTQHARLGQPRVLALSARAALDTETGRQAPGFVELIRIIDDLKEKKRRLSIKELNLAARTESLLADFRTSARLDFAEKGLTQLRGRLDQGRDDLNRLVDIEARTVLGVLRPSWKAGLVSEIRDRRPWPFGFFLFIWERLATLWNRNQAARNESSALPRPDLGGLNRRMETWRAELPAAFGPDESGPGQALARHIAGLPSPDETIRTAADALVSQGLQRAKRLTRRYRWRIRHHLLPLLVLAYPFFPLLWAGIWPLWTGAPPETAPVVQLAVGWRDLLPLLEVLVGLYLVETIYYGFSLDRASGRALDDLIREWRSYVIDMIRVDLIGPVEEFASGLAEELSAVKSMVDGWGLDDEPGREAFGGRNGPASAFGDASV